jgi:hypothetical protein
MLSIGRTIGFYRFNDKEFNSRVLIIFFLSAVGIMMTAHGLYQIWPDIPNICNSLVIATFMAMIAARFINKLIRDSNASIQGLFKITIAFYEKEERIVDHRPVLHAHLKLLISLLKFFFLFSLFGVCVVSPIAWTASWYTGEFILLAPVYLPFTDPYGSLLWYIINSSILTAYVLLLFFMFMTADVLYIFFIYQSVPMVEIYCMKLRKFGEKLVHVKTQKITEQVGPSTSKNHSRDLWNHAVYLALKRDKAIEIAIFESHFITLIKEFNTYNEYVAAVLFFMELTTFASMSLNSMAIAMAIVVMLYYSKAIGGIMILYLFSLVFTPCVQGTVILHQKEKLSNELWNFPWYELSNSKQKLFLQLIHLAQNANELTVPIIGDIDMELFAEIMNGAYSYFNYLYNFVEEL